MPGIKKSNTLSSITLNITTNNPSCGYNNGSILVTASGGTPPYIYSLSGNVQNNGYFTGVNATNSPYSILVKDVNGQSVTSQVSLSNSLPPPYINVIATKLPSTCTSADGIITVTVNGGVPPYTYSMDDVNFSANNIFTNLTTGAYYFFVKDANGCIAQSGLFGDVPGMFDPINPCGLRCTGEGTQYACSNYGSIDIGASGGVSPYLYSIDGVNYYPGSTIATNQSTPYNNLGPGLYTIYVKDANGTIAVSTYPIIKYCGVKINYVVVAAACQQNNGSITITAINGTPPYSYTMDGINFQSSNTFTGLGVGVYGFSVMDATGSIYSLQATVFDKCPKVTATETDETCGQGNGTITATGSSGTQPYLFSINDGSFQTSNQFTGLLAGNYKVMIQDANGFRDSTMVTVKNNCLQLSLSTTNTTCGDSNGSIDALASNGTAPYQYSIDGLNFVPNNVFSNLVAGNYTVTAMDANGLLKDSTVTISDAPGPQASITTTPASCTNSGGSITINATGGTAPLRFSTDNGNSYGTNNVFSNLDSGQYITVTKDANGCSFSDTTRLAALPTPSFSLGNDTSLCMGQSLLISAPDSPSYSYQWQDNSNGYTYLASANGLYSVKVTNGYGCSSSDTIKLAFRPLPVFSLGNDTTVCSGNAYTIGAKFNSPTTGFTYTWSDGTTGRPSLLVTAPGLYWMQSSDGGCAFRDSITVRYKASPAVALGNDTTLCDGQTLLLDAANNGSTYLWQDGSTQAIYMVDKAGSYSVKVDEDGCDTTGSITVAYISKPIVNIGNDTTVCVTQKLVLDAGYPNSTYEWQDGSTSPSYTVTTSGTYSVNVTDQCGATFDSIRVAYENCACRFYIPNGFTPNGDGINDLFLPKYQCLFSNYVLRVFNRWGQLVFSSNNPNTGWDGNLVGQQQPAGTYVWELAYSDSSTGKYMRKTGTVVLVR